MFHRFIAAFFCFSFILGQVQPVTAQQFSINLLPAPGTMVEPTPAFNPVTLKGIVVNTKNPLELQFILDSGKKSKNPQDIKEDANLLLKYFLTGLTIPEKDLWVNLSPYEKDRIIPQALGQTELGRDLLAQDYILKQLTASLVYPEKDLGRAFWNKVYRKAQEQFGTTTIPVNTFNKVWILPNQAQVYEHGNAAYVTKASLKVMLDEDYQAKEKHQATTAASISSQIVREIVIPEIEKEVNTGKNFAPLRQIYQALILAKWYKETVKNALFESIYNDKKKIAGVNVDDPTLTKQIYARYLEAYKKGVFNFVKEEQGPNNHVHMKKYFSGGTDLAIASLDRQGTEADVASSHGDMAMGVTLERLGGWLRNLGTRSSAEIPSDSDLLAKAIKKATTALQAIPELNRDLLNSPLPLGKLTQINEATIKAVEAIIAQFNQETFTNGSPTLRRKFIDNRNILFPLQSALIKRGFYLFHYSIITNNTPVLFIIAGTKKAKFNGNKELTALLVRPANPETEVNGNFYAEILQSPGSIPMNLIYLPDIEESAKKAMRIKTELASGSFNYPDIDSITQFDEMWPYAYRKFWNDPENETIRNQEDIIEKIIRIRLAAFLVLSTVLRHGFPIRAEDVSHYNASPLRRKVMIHLATAFLYSTQVEKIWLTLPETWKFIPILNEDLFTQITFTGLIHLGTTKERMLGIARKLLHDKVLKHGARQAIRMLFDGLFSEQPVIPELNFEIASPSLQTIDSLLNQSFVATQTKPSAAMTSPKELIDGGIDLKQIILNKEGKKVIINFDQAQLNQIMKNQFNGFNAQINNLFIIQNPLPILGVIPRKEVF